MPKSFFIFATVALAFLLALGMPLRAYVLEGQKWPNGTIPINLQLSSSVVAYPSGGLQDGSGTWNAVAQAALAEWNPYLANVQFTSDTTALTPRSPDSINSVFFSSTVFGDTFPSGALAITVRWFVGTTSTEADTVVSTAYQWDSYRGNLQPSSDQAEYVFDLRRVLDHEFGHNLGLNHPDLATPPQTVNAIMNSVTSNLDHIELDDIQGVWSMYGQKTVLEPVTVAVTPVQGGTISGAGNLQLGSAQTLTATPSAGYVFVKWDDGTTNPTRNISVAVQGNTYTATFALSLDNWPLATTFPYIGVIDQILFAKGQFFAFGGSGTNTSADGVTWVKHAGYSTNPGYVAYGNGIFVAVASNATLTSTDGLNWTSTASSYNSLYSVAFGNGIFVTMGNDPYQRLYFLTSTDGVNWTPSTEYLPGGYTVGGIAYGNGLYVAIANKQGSEDVSLYSHDAVTWLSTGIYANQGSIVMAYGNGRFLANGGAYGYVLTTLDGVTWGGGDGTPNNQTVSAITYGNGLYIALGSTNILSSVDATNWSILDASFQLDEPSACAFGGNIFIGTSNQSAFHSNPVGVANAAVLPVVNSGLTFSGVVNQALTYQIAGTHTPVIFNASGLPPGLSIDEQAGVISGTPTGTGTFPITLYATNDAGSGLATLVMTIRAAAVPQTFTSWATANNVTGGMSDTPRNDGIPNLLKYLYDIDPTVPVTPAARALLPVLAMASAGTELTLTFPENKVLENVDVAVESSTDLASWSTPDGSSITSTGTTNANGDTIMVAQVPATGTACQFIRLVVTPQ